VFRFLCGNSRTGSIIGKGGVSITHMREESCARIKVEHLVPGAEERVIVVSAPDTPDTDLSPSQNAAVRVYSRMMEMATSGGKDNEGANLNDAAAAARTVRLLVPSSQVGCLLGKGGCIINQMRDESGAQIRVMPKEQIPAGRLLCSALHSLVIAPFLSRRRNRCTVLSSSPSTRPASDLHGPPCRTLGECIHFRTMRWPRLLAGSGVQGLGLVVP